MVPPGQVSAGLANAGTADSQRIVGKQGLNHFQAGHGGGSLGCEDKPKRVAGSRLVGFPDRFDSLENTDPRRLCSFLWITYW